MKSNLTFIGLGVFCIIFFCINSTNGRNVRFIESKSKRQVEPLPEPKIEPKVEPNDGKSHDSEEQNKANDNIPVVQATVELDGKKEEETQKTNNDNLAAEQSPNSGTKATDVAVEVKDHKPLEETKAKEEPTSETAQPINKELAISQPQEEKKYEKDAADLKPAETNIAKAVVSTSAPRHERKPYRSLWSRVTE